ncbi:MAG: hypothetical protein WC375_06775 [Methanomassiliicoccales archaeon]|jgi:hypothetical protein
MSNQEPPWTFSNFPTILICGGSHFHLIEDRTLDVMFYEALVHFHLSGDRSF